MADTVSTIVLAAGPRNYVARFTNISDGTGESLVLKVDISTLSLGNGVAPTKVSVKEIQWSIQGFTSVQLYWDHTVDVLISALASGNGYAEYGTLGMLIDPGATPTGDVLLSTAGAISGATYDITLALVLS